MYRYSIIIIFVHLVSPLVGHRPSQSMALSCSPSWNNIIKTAIINTASVNPAIINTAQYLLGTTILTWYNNTYLVQQYLLGTTILTWYNNTYLVQQYLLKIKGIKLLFVTGLQIIS